jgi:hypothetical protein
MGLDRRLVQRKHGKKKLPVLSAPERKVRSRGCARLVLRYSLPPFFQVVDKRLP